MYNPEKYPTLASITQATDINDAISEYILINDTFTSPHQKLMLAILLASELMMAIKDDDRFPPNYVPKFIEAGAHEFAQYVQDTEYVLSDEMRRLLKELRIDGHRPTDPDQ